jgi:membrane fusion protein (multidrug efflux system)
VVSSGQTKLQNGVPVVVNNAIQPLNDPNPHPVER